MKPRSDTSPKTRWSFLVVLVGTAANLLLVPLVQAAGSSTLPAESASYGGGTVLESNYGGYHGGGFLNLPSSGGYVQFNKVDGGAGGSATVVIRYAQGSGTRTGSLLVNGKSQSITFNSTGSWSTWSTKTVTVSLSNGTANTLRFQSTGQDFANLDEITVTPASSTSSSSTTTTTSGALQAESASYGGGANVGKTYSGFHGSGYVDLPNSGGYVQFNNVDGGSGGSRTLTVRYAQASGTRTGSLIINGKTQSITFGSTGAWSTWKTLTVTVSLSSGTANTLRLQSSGQDFPNVDEITLGAGTSSSTTPTPTTSTSSSALQAESASYGGGTSVGKTYGGFHGSGYADLPNSGGYVQFNNVNGGNGGSATLTVRYAQASGTRTGSLIVNGKTQSITFNATGGWSTWGTAISTISLSSGTANTIRLQSSGQDFPNVDEIIVAPSGSSSTSSSSPAPSTSTSSGSIFNSSGGIDATKYKAAAMLWDVESASARFGPTFAQLHPGATDTRPTLYTRTSKTSSTDYSARVRKYELGTLGGWSNYHSSSGQVGYVPDSSSDPGLDRIQTYAFYNHVFAISPRLDPMATVAHPDPETQDSGYTTMNGERPKQPIAMVRNYGLLSNEALVLYRDGLLGVAGTQTSRLSTERPYPGLMFPENKVPTGIALTTLNEFALVTIWDTSAMKGQLAVVALEGKFLSYHTWPFMGLANQGSWSSFKLLGYIDLPMAAPSSVSASSNGWWESPGTTGGKALSEIDPANDSTRKLLWDGNWQGVVATKGYAIVASKQENKVCFVDLSPLFAYIRSSYFSSVTSFLNTVATRGSGSTQFPKTFSALSSIKPKVVYTTTVTRPTAVLAGIKLNRWTQDRHKAYVASEDGTISIFDTSSLKKRWDYEKLGTLQKMGSFKVGRNPVSMAFMRYSESGVPLIPKNSDGTVATDPLNGMFYVACRGDREIDGVVSFGSTGTVYRRIQDTRMGDPVAVAVADRANIVSVADFLGKKILSFRVGTFTDADSGKTYGCGAAGTDKFEFAGQLSFAGHPFLVGSSNVN